MKTFKSFIQLDELERVKYKAGNENKFANASYLAQVKDPGDLEKVGPEEVGPHDTKLGQGKRPADRLDNKQPFGEAESHQSKTTMKHVSNPNAGEKKAAKDIKPGIKGYKDRIAMLKAAKARGALKEEDAEQIDETVPTTGLPIIGKPPSRGVSDAEFRKRVDAALARFHKPDPKKVNSSVKSKVKEDVDLLSNLYDQLDESNQEIFLNQLEEDAEVLLAFAKTIAEE